MSKNLELKDSFPGEVWVRARTEECVAHYEVSNMGRVRNLKSPSLRVLKPRRIAGNNAAIVVLSYPYMGHVIQSKRSLRKLVIDAFDLNPQKLPLIDHIDGNPLNCAVDNLRFRDYKRSQDKQSKSEKLRMKEDMMRITAQQSWDKLTYAQQQDELRMYAQMSKGTFLIEEGVFLRLPDESHDTVTFNERQRTYNNPPAQQTAPQPPLDSPLSNTYPQGE